MEFHLDAGFSILQRTPAVLDAMLRGVPESLIHAREGAESWSPFDIVGHLIHGERTDWIPRIEHLLRFGQEKAFTPFDRFAQFQASRGKTLAELLDTFAELRAANLARLPLLLAGNDLTRGGLHPELGPVTLEQLLATWVVHDLNHLAQTVRVMGRQYADAVGPWRAYLPMLGSRQQG
jgi:hypothetical protein